jgi:ACS family tartrate transporter-like MFS transporter
MALFATGAVIAGIIGSPVSGAILGMDGAAGLAGWQWLFLLEGIPAVLLGLVVLFVLPNGPAKARWLSPKEKTLVQHRLDEEIAQRKEQVHFKLSQALKSKWVWLLCLVYFLLNVGGYGYELWMPSIINDLKGLKFTSLGIGLVNAVPYLLAGIAMFLVGRNSDRTGDRRWHVAVSAAVSATGFFLSAYFNNPFLALAALTIAFIGLKSTVGPFWALATSFLTGTAAAGGIAFINSVGNLGGFAGPYLVGVLKDKTGNNQVALFILGGALLLMGIVILLVRKVKR